VIAQSPVEEKSTATTILFKNNEFDYENCWFDGPGYEKWAWLILFQS
jgi:hypothetical protein